MALENMWLQVTYQRGGELVSIADIVYFSAAYKPVQCTQTANGFVLVPKSSHSIFASSRICGYSSVGRHFTHMLPFAVWCQDWYPFKVGSMKHAIFRDATKVIGRQKTAKESCTGKYYKYTALVCSLLLLCAVIRIDHLDVTSRNTF